MQVSHHFLWTGSQHQDAVTKDSVEFFVIRQFHWFFGICDSKLQIHLLEPLLIAELAVIEGEIVLSVFIGQFDHLRGQIHSEVVGLGFLHLHGKGDKLSRAACHLQNVISSPTLGVIAQTVEKSLASIIAGRIAFTVITPLFLDLLDGGDLLPRGKTQLSAR